MTRTELNKLLIIDLEATCWKNTDAKDGLQTKIEKEMEIIEIGWAIIQHPDWRTSASGSILVKPSVMDISEFCTELTGHTEEELTEGGIPLKEALDELIRLVPKLKDTVWASWGDYDRKQFHRECNRKQIKYPFRDSHINIKTLFSFREKIKKGKGVSSALKIKNMEFEGRPHNGGDDARNIARLARTIL